MPNPEEELSNAYYTRFHIWQGLVRSAELKGYSPDGLAAAATEGWDFIWGDGSDVFEEKTEKEIKGQAKIIEEDHPLKNTYL